MGLMAPFKLRVSVPRGRAGHASLQPVQPRGVFANRPNDRLLLACSSLSFLRGWHLAWWLRYHLGCLPPISQS